MNIGNIYQIGPLTLQKKDGVWTLSIEEKTVEVSKSVAKLILDGANLAREKPNAPEMVTIEEISDSGSGYK